MNADTHRGKKRVSDPLELELKAVVCFPTKFRPYPRTVRILSH